jgi:hypothetical protein
LAELTKRQRKSTIFTGVEPPHRCVQEASSLVVHHQDYLNRRDDHGDADALMDAVTEDHLYQTPKTTKRRLGRPRLRNGS